MRVSGANAVAQPLRSLALRVTGPFTLPRPVCSLLDSSTSKEQNAYPARGAHRAVETEEEQKNLATAEEFMSLIYDPATSSAKAVADLLASDCEFASGNMPQVTTCSMWADVMGSMVAQAPDFAFNVNLAFAKDNLVAVHFFVSGTHTKGDHKGMNGVVIPPTNKSMKSPGILLFEFDDAGKISKIWNEWDLFSMWTQLGWTEELCGKA